MKKCSVFEFNHIDKLLKEEEIETLKELYSYYQKNFGVIKKLSNISRSLMKPSPFLVFFW